jgi:hypothetical protein
MHQEIRQAEMSMHEEVFKPTSFVPKERLLRLGFKPECRSRTDRRIVGPAAFLEGEDVLPGFHLSVVDLFKNWEW